MSRNFQNKKKKDTKTVRDKQIPIYICAGTTYGYSFRPGMTMR